MQTEMDNSDQISRYLLGKLSEEEQVALEQRFFDDAVFEQLLALENEMAYDCAQGVLPESECAAFEQRLLVGAEDRQRVEMAKALLDRLAVAGDEDQLAPDRLRPRKASWFRSLIMFFSAGFVARPAISYSLVTALAVLLAVSAWLIVRNQPQPASGTLEARQTSGKTSTEQTATERRASGEQPPHVSSSPDHLAQQSGIPKPTQPQTAIKEPLTTPIISLVLTPGSVRGGSETKVLHLNQTLGTVELLLTLKNKVGYKSYAVVLSNVDGAQIWRRGGLRANTAGPARTISVRVPVRVLAEGDYEIELGGLSSSGESEVIGDYYLTVLKR